MEFNSDMKSKIVSFAGIWEQLEIVLSVIRPRKAIIMFLLTGGP